MKILFSILMLFFALLGISQDENPFGDVSFFDDLDKPPQDHKKFVLNVEKSIFGVAPYSTEKQIIKKLGNPTASLELTKSRKALVYGNQIAFILKRDKLKVVHIEPTMGVFQSSISDLRKKSKSLERVSWKFSNGISSFSCFRDVKGTLKEDFKFQNKHSGDWERKNCNIRFNFFGINLGGGGDFDDPFALGEKENSDMEYSVYSVKIEYKPIENENKPIIFLKENNPGVLLDIEPNKHFLGMLIGTSKKELVREFGAPSGSCELKNGGQGLIYGHQTVFLFKENKLNGIHFNNDGVVADSFKYEMKGHSVFDNFKWKLTNGIKIDSSLEEVKKKFGAKFKSQGKWQGDFDAEKAVGRFEFYRTSIDGVEGDADRNYKLKNITIFSK